MIDGVRWKCDDQLKYVSLFPIICIYMRKSSEIFFTITMGLQGEPKNGLFLRIDKFVTANGRKVCDIIKVSEPAAKQCPGFTIVHVVYNVLLLSVCFVLAFLWLWRYPWQNGAVVYTSFYLNLNKFSKTCYCYQHVNVPIVYNTRHRDIGILWSAFSLGVKFTCSIIFFQHKPPASCRLGLILTFPLDSRCLPHRVSKKNKAIQSVNQ